MNFKNTKFDLSNRVALITGGAGLLGVNNGFALLQTGAEVFLTDIDQSKLEIARHSLLQKGCKKNKIHILMMDVSNETSILDVAKKLESKNKKINILINNAALNPTASSLNNDIRTTRLENFSVERWDKEFDIGLKGAFLCSKIFGSIMADNKGGVILNIASDLSIIAPNQALYFDEKLPEDLQAVKPVTYSVIKHGLIGLTKYLATYWPHKNIRANSISPGGIFTGQDEVFVSRINQLIPMGRMAKEDEYNSAIQFLCSDASEYMNGHNLVMDGGRTII